MTIPIIGRKETVPGTPWQCPFCGWWFPLAQTSGSMVPVQAVNLPVFQPIANLVDTNGRALNMDPVKMIAAGMCRETFGFVPHLAVCRNRAKVVGMPGAPIEAAMKAPPPDCKCGHPWVAHQEFTQAKDGLHYKSGGCSVCECDLWEEVEVEPS